MLRRKDGLEALYGAADNAPHALEVGRQLEETEDPQRAQCVEHVLDPQARDGGEELEDGGAHNEEVEHVEADREVLAQAYMVRGVGIGSFGGG